jgi:two-component system, OmpR family, sensor histidine kinase PhoQ
VHSLSRRLLISVSVPLVIFFGVTIAVLDASFRDLAEQSLQAQLDAQMVALIAAAEPQPNGTVAPATRSLESRLGNPGSGLYAQIRAAGQKSAWRSQSTAGTFIDFGPELNPGQKRFGRVVIDGAPLAIASRGIAFEDEGRGRRNLTFSVATSLAPYHEQLWSFRRRLSGWFVGLTLLLLATLGMLLRWVLAPVRRLEREIHAVEEGTSEKLGAGYPRELSGVAGNLNALLIGERKRVARYRDTLGNLAHSLKTPLAVIRSTLSSAAPALAGAIGTEIDRMSGIVDHQLKRAAASGGVLLGQVPVEIAPIAAELRTALMKVHSRKDFAIELAIAPDAQFSGDRSDLTELLGNLLDNAAKWCRSRVRVAVSFETGATPRENLCITVEDDGPGISAPDRARVFGRGVRADEKVKGHGLGLAMVRDTVELYGGKLSVGTSGLGGARLSIHLPGKIHGATLNTIP